MPLEPTPDFLLRLRPLSADVPLDARLRGALKVLLRKYRLKCVEIREVPVPGRIDRVPDPENEAPGPP